MAENTGDASDAAKGACLHVPCRCNPREGQSYCSDYCASLVKEGQLQYGNCLCGNPACTSD